MREQLIAEKKESLLRELISWAEANDILKPGECLLFSLQVGIGSAGLRNVSNVYEMNAREFFSTDRLCSFGVSHSIAVRISNVIKNGWYWNAERTEQINYYENMRDFLALYASAYDLMHIPNLGKKCVKEMIIVMRKNGFLLEGPKWKID